MKIELYINNQLMDIDENTEISLTKEFQSDEDLERKEVQYSYELELPITLANQKVFGYANSLDVKHKFYQQYNAQLYAEHILVLDGKFMLTEINNESFIGNLYVPSYKELKDVLGNKKLNEIMEHNITIQDFSSLNLLNEVVLAGGEMDVTIDVLDTQYTIHYENNHVCFPYILYNFTKSKFIDTKWDSDSEEYYTENIEENGLVQFTDYTDTNFSINGLYPSYNVLSLIKEMFKSYGYDVSGNIFDDKRFKDLWMTSSFDNGKYKNEIMYPQYVDVYGNYEPFNWLINRVTETASYHEKSINDGEQTLRYWSDDLMHSNAVSYMFGTNPHEMFHKSEKSGGSIIINRSGWYLVNLDATVTQPYSSLGGGTNVSDRGSFDVNQVELRLVKGEARTNTDWYSQFGQAPIVPRYNDTKNMAEINYNASGGNYNTYGWTKMDVSDYARIPKNGGVAVVHDYSNMNTKRFICGARFGIATERTRKNFFEYDHIGKHVWVMHALPNKNNCDVLYYDEGSDSYVLPITGGKYGGERPTIHTDDTAVVLMSENVYSFNGGYYKLTPGVEILNPPRKSINWDKGANGFANPPKIRQSYAGFETPTYGVYKQGVAKCTCVAWLEEGETINLESLVSVDYVDLRRMPAFGVQYRIEMGLLSTDKAWKPEGNNIIPEAPTQLWKAYSNNINKFLPDMSCNDFIEAFMKTFNLRITKIADNEYSINYSDIRHTTLNVVPLDKYLDYSKVSEKSIDLPSEYNFKFNISEDEEGFVSGDNSMFCQNTSLKSNEKPNYDGHKTIRTNMNDNGDSVDVESRFSYNWYKTVWTTKKEKYKQWVEAGKPNPKDAYKTYGGEVFKVPVIADATSWNKTFGEASTEAEKTTATPRFFYLDKSHTLTINDGDQTKIFLVSPRNDNNGFDIDYNSIPTFIGIEESLFSTVIEPSYEVQIELAMSNEDYQKIQQNSLIKINDELYRVVKIDGHSVTGEADADLVLKAII